MPQAVPPAGPVWVAAGPVRPERTQELGMPMAELAPPAGLVPVAAGPARALARTSVPVQPAPKSEMPRAGPV